MKKEIFGLTGILGFVSITILAKACCFRTDYGTQFIPLIDDKIIELKASKSKSVNLKILSNRARYFASDSARRVNNSSEAEKFVNWKNIDSLADLLWKISNEDKQEYVKNVMDFIALNTEYKLDGSSGFLPVGEYVKRPLETLIQGGGDCEDLTVLAASFLSWAPGIHIGLVYSDEHVALGISYEGGEVSDILDTVDLLNGKVKFGDGFSKGDINEFNVISVDSDVTYNEAKRIWKQKGEFIQFLNDNNQEVYLKDRKSGFLYSFNLGDSLLTKIEQESLSLEDASRLSQARIREAAKSSDYISIKIVDDRKSSPYFYLESTAAGGWKFYSDLPEEMSFTPLSKDQYRLNQIS